MNEVAVIHSYKKDGIREIKHKEGKEEIIKADLPADPVNGLSDTEENEDSKADAAPAGHDAGTLAVRLKSVRTDHGLTVKAMAESVFLTSALWSALEKGAPLQSPTIPWYLHCIYHLNEEWIETGTGEKYESDYTPGESELGRCQDYSEKLKTDVLKLAEELQLNSLSRKNIAELMKMLPAVKEASSG
ncbi:MAG: helix-turn-helix domain-containing protein [Oscillospiraceae bacterium]|nr:helix-turn-helix domain-containing protein [Oscillospiraceae bacterium]